MSSAFISRACNYYVDQVRDHPDYSNPVLQIFFIKPMTLGLVEIFAVATLTEGAVRFCLSAIILPFTYCLNEGHPFLEVYERHFSLLNCSSGVCTSLTLFLPYLVTGVLQIFVPKMKDVLA